MRRHIIEATTPANFNWGKFMLLQFDEEWSYVSKIVPAYGPESYPGVIQGRPLLREIGIGRTGIFVLDLQTGEGALFYPHGLASADLNKHRIWVCPMYEPFLQWLYKQDLSDITTLPGLIDLGSEAEGHCAIFGHRRPGPDA